MNYKEFANWLKDGMFVVVKDTVNEGLWAHRYAGERVEIRLGVVSNTLIKFIDHKNVYNRAGENDSNLYGMSIYDVSIEKTIELNERSSNELNW